ncbi:diguanylate cyclase domain-containing protein [Ornithinibacillus salinisoli]|uniref:Diguanylate cyclase domain-containing protein n=1 Tax=Ornithinibacillus salinisoli TaxID=1848459 RepID=A0ABW4VXF0_9BACI
MKQTIDWHLIMNQRCNFRYEKLIKLALTDELTGLSNLRNFRMSLQSLIKQSDEKNKQFGILFLDINHFKSINDKYGHIIGDKLLIECAKRLSEVVKSNVFHKSGDEFLMIIDDVDQMNNIIVDIQRQFQRDFLIENKPVFCHISIGSSIYPLHGQSEEELLKYADIVMYQHKKVIKATSDDPY